METSTTDEAPNVAVSPLPFGTEFEVQLAAVFQSPETGFESHLPLPAEARGVVAAQTSAKRQTRGFMDPIDAESVSPVEPNQSLPDLILHPLKGLRGDPA